MEWRESGQTSQLARVTHCCGHQIPSWTQHQPKSLKTNSTAQAGLMELSALQYQVTLAGAGRDFSYFFFFFPKYVALARHRNLCQSPTSEWSLAARLTPKACSRDLCNTFNRTASNVGIKRIFFETERVSVEKGRGESNHTVPISVVSAWISFSFGFFLGGGGSAGFFSQTLRFVDILLGHSPPSEDITLSCLVKTRESLGEKGHIVAVLRQDWDAADWIYSQLYCWVPMPAALTAMGACTTLWMFGDARNIIPSKGCARTGALW